MDERIKPHIKGAQYEDLTGQTFGNWTALGFAGKVSHGALTWLCECVCGTKRVLRGSNFKSNKPISCGCHKQPLDLTGYKYAMLTVLEKSSKTNNANEQYWKCKCECGVEKSILERALKYNLTKSCGCLVRGRNRYEFETDYVTIYDSSNESFIVDYETYNKIKDTYWSIGGAENYVGKAYKYVFGAPEVYSQRVRLHRYIFELNPDDKDVVDHINHNTLDNRMNNLRRVTRSQNAMNMVIPQHNTSGYKGVTWNKNETKWVAQIKINQINEHLGYFDNIDDAIKAREFREKELFGGFSYDA